MIHFDFSIMTKIKKLFTGIIFFQFSVFVVCTVLGIGSFENSVKSLSLESVCCFNEFLMQFVSVYALCICATKLTTKSTEMGDKIYYSAWYSLSLKQQKMIVPMIQQGQNEFFLDGFNIFPCSMETFLKVIFHQ